MSMITGAHQEDDPNFVPWANEVDEAVLALDAQNPIKQSDGNAKGQIPVHDGSSWTMKSVGSAGTVPRSDPSASNGITYGRMYTSGLFSARPAATGVLPDTEYYATDRKEQWISDGASWSLKFGIGSTDLLVSSGGTFAMRRLSNQFDNVGTASQVLKLTYFRCQRTETISEIRCWVGAVAAAATPTRCQFGLWTAETTGELTALVASTPNDTALFNAPLQSAKTKSLSSSYTLIKEQYYAVGLLVVSGAATPQFGGCFVGVDAESGAGDRWAGQVTGQSTLPSTLAAASVADASSVVQFQLI